MLFKRDVQQSLRACLKNVADRPSWAAIPGRFVSVTQPRRRRTYTILRRTNPEPNSGDGLFVWKHPCSCSWATRLCLSHCLTPLNKNHFAPSIWRFLFRNPGSRRECRSCFDHATDYFFTACFDLPDCQYRFTSKQFYFIFETEAEDLPHSKWRHSFFAISIFFLQKPRLRSQSERMCVWPRVLYFFSLGI